METATSVVSQKESKIEIWKYPNDIKKLKRVSYQRKPSQGRIDRLSEVLKQNGRIDSPIVVNRRANGDLYLLDGRHRIDAMAKNDVPLNNIKAEVYDGLTPEQEKDIYYNYNAGTPHNANDLIRPYADEIMFCKEVTNPRKFPIRIVLYQVGGNQVNCMAISTLLDAYNYAKTKKILRKTDMVEYAKELTTYDLKSLKSFFNDMREALGSYDRRIDIYRNGIIKILLKLYIKYVVSNKISRGDFRTRVIWLKGQGRFIDTSMLSVLGVGLLYNLGTMIVNLMNGHFRYKISWADTDES